MERHRAVSVGLAQIQTGRFEDALATFQQADRFDTPQVSRWTWMIGAGWANMLMGRAEDAMPWLQSRSPSHRPAGALICCWPPPISNWARPTKPSRDGKGPELRPGSTVLNVPPPKKNASPVYVEAAERIIQFMIAAGCRRVRLDRWDYSVASRAGNRRAAETKF